MPLSASKRIRQIADQPDLLSQRRRKARSGTKLRDVAEHTIQRTVVQHLKLRALPGVYWSSIDHASRDDRLNIERASRGVKPGLPDILILAGGKAYALELKTEAGSQSQDQIITEREWNLAGGIYAVSRGIDAALAQLEAWGVIVPDRGRRAA